MIYVYDGDEVEGKKFDMASKRGTKRAKSIKAQYVHLISFIVYTRPLSIVNGVDQVERVALNKRIISSSMGFKTIKFFCYVRFIIENLSKKSHTSYTI